MVVDGVDLDLWQGDVVDLLGGVDHAAGPVIEVHGLRMSYGRGEVLAGFDLEVHAGEVFAFLGPNGAGKTTTVEILEGYRRRDRG